LRTAQFERHDDARVRRAAGSVHGGRAGG
jgi:hypothetical protein